MGRAQAAPRYPVELGGYAIKERVRLQRSKMLLCFLLVEDAVAVGIDLPEILVEASVAALEEGRELVPGHVAALEHLLSTKKEEKIMKNK